MDQTAVKLCTLDESVAKRFGETLIAFNQDSEWDYWTLDNLLTDRTLKWELSVIAFHDNAPIGYAICSMKQNSLHLHHLVVGGEWRSQSVGKFILEKIAQNAIIFHQDKITLKVYHFNAKAIRFYQKYGFMITKESQDSLIHMAGHAPTIMEKVASL